MNRINKIVARKKDEMGKSGTDKVLAERKTVTANTRQFEYTQTRRVQVDLETLKENRVVATDPSDPVATRFQMLRTKVLQQMRKKNWNTLAITAPSIGAGKSMIAANLAASIAQEGNQSVLLVDMDLRSPSVHNYFGLVPDNGIHDCLDGTVTIEQTLINPGLERLVILPGRKGVINSSEQISTPYVKNLVQELKTRYESRVVIFDLPPILATDDVLVFLPYVDCSLMVVGAGVDSKKDVEESLALIGNNPLIGTVLNKAEFTDKSFIY